MLLMKHWKCILDHFLMILKINADKLIPTPITEQRLIIDTIWLLTHKLYNK
jgi:hypothetical protein